MRETKHSLSFLELLHDHRTALSRLESSPISHPVMSPVPVNTVTQAVVSTPCTTEELPQHLVQMHLQGLGDQTSSPSIPSGEDLSKLSIRAGPRPEKTPWDLKVLADNSQRG